MSVELLAAAWAWAFKLREESTTESDVAGWLAWYDADEAHRQAFDSVQMLWHGAQGVLDGPGAPTLKELLGESSAEPRGQPTIPASARRLWPSRWNLGLATAIAVALLAISSVWMLFIRISRAPMTVQSVVSTGRVPAVQREILPDGSNVELAPRSALVLHFTKSMRSLDLKSGEAYFAVAHNRLRPFVVTVGALHVTDLGTAFNIRKAGDRIVVAVNQGTVVVSGSAARASEGLTVPAGYQATWASASSRPVIAPADPQQTLAWQEGRLVYLDEPLSGVIADINRYTSKPVIIRDPGVGRLLFSGTVFTDATGVWLQALPRVFPVKLLRDPNGDWVLVQSDSL